MGGGGKGKEEWGEGKKEGVGGYRKKGRREGGVEGGS